MIHPLGCLSSYKCCFCPNKVYGTVSLLRKHLVKQHSANEREVIDSVEGANINVINYDIEIETDHDNNEILDVQLNELAQDEISVLDFKLALYTSSLSLSAKLYSVPSLNRFRIQSILEMCSDFSGSGFLDLLESKVIGMLRNFNGPQQDLLDLGEMFNSLRNSLEGLETESQRVAALKEYDAYFTLQSYFIGRDWIMKKVNGIEQRVLVELTGQYNCMKKILKKFLQLPGVFQSTLDNINELNRSDTFSNFIQGELWKNVVETYFQGRLVRPLVLYFDDAEPNNQKGSHSGTHSLGLLYYFILSIPQYLLSRLENLFVAAVFLTHSQRCRNQETFQIVIDVLKDSERDGIEIKVDNETHQIIFAVGLILGDNKGVNGMTGFVESFSARYYCRICKQHRDQSRVQTVQDVNLLRNPSNYQEDVLLNDTLLTGIKSECVCIKTVMTTCTV
ncbi:hypothetical protein FOCC_FOCC008663 [Frankliniella occidentalis]|nr:hypothetical protein FOCC_FOCC008663 [Frankliniella occidentalis]